MEVRTFSSREPSPALRRVPDRTTGSFRWGISRTVLPVTWRPVSEWKESEKLDSIDIYTESGLWFNLSDARTHAHTHTHLLVIQVFGFLEKLLVDLDFFAQSVADVFQRLVRQVIVVIILLRWVFASETLGKGGMVGRRTEQALFDADPVLFEIFRADRGNSRRFVVRYVAVVIVRKIIAIVTLYCAYGKVSEYP